MIKSITNKARLSWVPLTLLFLIAWFFSMAFPSNADFGSKLLAGAVFFIQLVVFYYSLDLYGIPQLFNKRDYAGSIVFAIALLISYTLIDFLSKFYFDLAHLVDFNLKFNGERISYPENGESLTQTDYLILPLISFAQGAFILGIIFFILMIKQNIQNSLKLQKLEKEKLKKELKYIRAQNQPHVLFNNLNSIYVLIDEDKDLAKKSLLQLSQMLRFQIYEARNSEIEVSKELDYINSYLELYQQRLSKPFQLIKNIEIEADKAFKIEPFILFTFVENAVKHGIEEDGDENYLKLGLKISDDELLFELENSVHPEKAENNEMDSGFGLNSVKNRLSALYPDNHKLNINNTGNAFKVSLKLNLH